MRFNIIVERRYVMYTIALTGASGAMGEQTLRELMSSDKNYHVNVLLLNDAENNAFKRKAKKLYGDRLTVVTGDLVNYEDCKKLVNGCDYVMHVGALIPPRSDHNAERTRAVNFGGTVNLVKAAKECEKEPAFIYISSVAVYGNRNYLHPWGRVGDPLLPSAFDVYAATKVRAERYVMESGLKKWAVLRQTAMLHKKMLMNNVKDGLMFHTSWNAPLEWSTSDDSGFLMRQIADDDVDGKCDEFWYKVYNIGGGFDSRRTGFDTFDGGFKLIGGSAESFFKPVWNIPRNFHGLWFADSDILENMFHFRHETVDDYWNLIGKMHPEYKVAKILPPALIRKLVIERLLSDENAPMKWVKEKSRAKIAAMFGSTDNIDFCPVEWKDYPLLCKGQLVDGEIDYNKIRDEKYAKENGYLLDHGYDETKPDSELDISDLQSAAAFRGGKLITADFKKGDIYTPVEWECHNGHRFKASPFVVLKAGHWCPECCMPEPWSFDLSAKKVPFFAQVWYDTHAKNENAVYYYDEYGKPQGYRLMEGQKCKI